MGRHRRFMARASFRLDDGVDPGATGIDLTLRAADGAVLYRAALPGWALRARPHHRVVRYHRRSSRHLPDARGLRTLVLRQRGPVVTVRVRAVVRGLKGRTPRPLGLGVRLGEQCATAARVECRAGARRMHCG
jgi:hypothetical protein